MGLGSPTQSRNSLLFLSWSTFDGVPQLSTDNAATMFKSHVNYVLGTPRITNPFVTMLCKDSMYVCTYIPTYITPVLNVAGPKYSTSRTRMFGPDR